MSKSAKNLVREILEAQGITGVDPTPAAVAAMQRIKNDAYSEGAVDYSMDLEG